jgi:cyclohexanecarboxyl-CoA dehydrogenase
MEFALTSEQEAIRDMARRFASERLAPGYQAREAEGRMEPALIEEMGALGLIAPDMPEEVGGAGTDGVTAGVITEEIAAGDFNFSYPLLLGSLNGSILMQHAAPEVGKPVVAEMTRPTSSSRRGARTTPTCSTARRPRSRWPIRPATSSSSPAPEPRRSGRGGSPPSWYPWTRRG